MVVSSCPSDVVVLLSVSYSSFPRRVVVAMIAIRLGLCLRRSVVSFAPEFCAGLVD